MVISVGAFHRKGGTDIPILDGGTGASVAATALSNLGGLDTTAHDAITHLGAPWNLLDQTNHDALDHTGLTGAGIGVVLDSTTTLAQLNAALVANPIVYLLPGNYPVYSGTLTIPINKALIGLGRGNTAWTGSSSSRVAILSWNTAPNPSINLIGYELSNVVITTNVSSTNTFLQCGNGNNVTIKNVGIDSGNNWNGRVIDVGNRATYMDNVSMTSLGPTASTATVFIGNPTSPYTEHTGSVIRNCVIEYTTKPASVNNRGFWTQGSISFQNCRVENVGGEGFYQQSGGVAALGSLWGCSAHGCGVDGFNDAGGGWRWISVFGCIATSNLGRGFWYASNGANPLAGSLVGNHARANTGPAFTIGTSYISSANTA
jgi:hypothetical protein